MFFICLCYIELVNINKIIMQYKDSVYGIFDIQDEVVIDLINSKFLQRLKYIDQTGYRALWVKPQAKIKDIENSRFNHSIGVYLLLKKYNASLEEQIAGLIHDVSHSAFSHCIDYVFVDDLAYQQKHQDNMFVDFIYKTDIPEILLKYGYDLEFILDDKNFPLKETELPDLCADRLDYSLRTAVIFEEINESTKQNILNNLIVVDNNWVFKDYQTARYFAYLFRELNRKYYAGVKSALMFKIVSDYLKYALKRGYINEIDLYTTDKQVLDKIKLFLNKDEELYKLWLRLNGQFKFENNPDDYDFSIKLKSRLVDPLFIDQNNFKKVSEKDKELANILKNETKPFEYFLKIY